jgi:hypothetical protein
MKNKAEKLEDIKVDGRTVLTLILKVGYGDMN